MSSTSASRGKCPIILMSFNRPMYLKALLETLLQQKDADIGVRHIALFQDGVRNEYANVEKCKQEEVDACIEIFKAMIPQGQVFASDANLGVALNFDRAEMYAFDHLKAEAAIFLEDDLLLSDYYIRILDGLVTQYAEDTRIGYVSAYGDHKLGLDIQLINKDKLMTMHHNWAFALFKRHWNRSRVYIEQYLDFVRGRDYSQRDHLRIKELFSSWGYPGTGTSQDCAKTLACRLTGAIKVNTVACFGRYIGETGLHMDSALYLERNYGATEVFNEFVPGFESMTDALFLQIGAELDQWGGKGDVASRVNQAQRGFRKSPRLVGNGFLNRDESISSTVIQAVERLNTFRAGTTDGRRVETLMHCAAENLRAANTEAARSVAVVAISRLMESAMPEGQVSVGFYPVVSIRDSANPAHVRLDWRNNSLRVLCANEMLKPQFTNYFEPFVILAVLASALIVENPPNGGLIMDFGGGANAGTCPRISFSSALAQAELILDPTFFHSRGYRRFGSAVECAVPWRDRENVIYWRGKSTGIQVNGPSSTRAELDNWRWLQRLNLCNAALLSRYSKNLDVGISQIVQIDSELVRKAIVAASFTRPPSSDISTLKFRYLIAVDGNTSADNGMFAAMRAGACIFMVDSAFGFRSWFYDRLMPWTTHIPVSADLSDLDDRIEWALAHEDECERMACCALDLARSMTFIGECEVAAKKIIGILKP